ncbi:hypothetical protein FRC04_006781 [Tulasnella sp. 424]|nr:hypothetical protein FRC04_006781 [Tulasnella sp. 424]
MIPPDQLSNHPFGYDMKDLNLAHFTRYIVRIKLAALTTRLPPILEGRALQPDNNNASGKRRS